ncbi:MAG: putative nucleotide-diphospho-sugar transferase [Opitutales bacterium]
MPDLPSNETVLVAAANAAYARAGMADNWLRSVRQAGVQNPVHLYALSKKTQRILERQGIESRLWVDTQGAITQRQPEFRSKAWKRLVLCKLALIHAELKAGHQVLYSDLDACFLRNPVDWLERCTPADGISVQSDFLLAQAESVGRLCTGFMFLKPGPRTLRVMDLNRDDVEAFPSDQPLLNDRMLTRQEAPVVRIDLDLIPNGPHWRRQGAQLRESAAVLHLSYVLGLQQKIKFFRNAGLWQTPHGRLEYLRLRARGHWKQLRKQPSFYLQSLRRQFAV